jgi:hypothetical protein
MTELGVHDAGMGVHDGRNAHYASLMKGYREQGQAQSG